MGIKRKRILILTSGSVSRLKDFEAYDVTIGSFKDINFILGEREIKIKTHPLEGFDVIYFRFVGNSFEVATLVANYSKVHGIRVVDKVYESSHLMGSSLGKSIELRKLSDGGIPIPKTVFGDFSEIEFPYVVKSTTGQRSREVWLVNNEAELSDLMQTLDSKKFYFAQEYIKNVRRIRVLVVGYKVVGALVRRTKWDKVGVNEPLNPIPKEICDISIRVAKVSELDICGVDILINENNNIWVIEANAAPSWKSLNRDCGVVVEEKIIEYLNTVI